MRLTPRGIREHLGLNKAIYARTSAYGHFGRKPGRDGGFSWEKTDLADAIKKAVGAGRRREDARRGLRTAHADDDAAAARWRPA